MGRWIKEMRLASIGKNQVGVIRFRHYGSSMQELLAASAEAKRDFPGLKDEEIRVVQYGGERFARTFGIEFELPPDTGLPVAYTQIKELELTL